MPAAPTYVDGSYSAAFAVSLPVFEAPLPHTSAVLVLRQQWCIALASYSALALNTAHPDYSDYKLVSEGHQVDLGAGVVQWERVYAKVPDTYSEYGGQYTYLFPGFWGQSGININHIEGREPFSENVPTKIEYEFILVGTGGSYSDEFNVPVETPTQYFRSVGSKEVVNILGDSPPLAVATDPRRSVYENMVADDAVSRTSFSITVEVRMERWLGNIWRKSTIKVKAL